MFVRDQALVGRPRGGLQNRASSLGHRSVFNRLFHFRQFVLEVEGDLDFLARGVVVVKTVQVRLELLAIPDDLSSSLLQGTFDVIRVCSPNVGP